MNTMEDTITTMECFIDFTLPIFGIVTYIFDVGSDIWLAVTYAQAGQWWWFGWTITFVIITGLVMAGFAFMYLFRWGWDDPLPTENLIVHIFVFIVVACSLTSPILG